MGAIRLPMMGWRFAPIDVALRAVARSTVPKASKPKPKPAKPARRDPKKTPAPRFAPSAFLSAKPAALTELTQALAEQAAGRFVEQATGRFVDAEGVPWSAVGRRFVEQLRSLGHDLICFDETPTSQEWTAEWHHERGLLTLTLAFRAPSAVVVTWSCDGDSVIARAGK